MSDCPLLVVGAGPAGMSAAITATECGMRVTLVDENAVPGGQIYRQSAVAASAEAQIGNRAVDRGDALRARLCELGGEIDLLTSTRVWGVFESKHLAVAGPDGWNIISAERLVLAPGAYEFVPPFPGWTLPGVYTPGGAQTVVKSMRVLPGRRALVVGTGPFLLLVATALRDAGVDVRAVVEAVRPAEVVRQLAVLARQPDMLVEGWRYLRRLKRAGIPLITGHVIVEARGPESIEHAVIARCDRSWSPDRSASRSFEVDTLCVGYGFVPRIQLAQLAGCRLDYSDELGGWIPEVDENGQTSVPGIWSAGDGAGVAGALVAELEGGLAGLAAARDAETIEASEFDERSRPIKNRLKKLRRFRAALDRLSRVRPGLTQLAREDTVVCRCEELTLAEVRAAIDAGSRELRSLKVATRLGMGPCQGRMCWPGVARWMAESHNLTVRQLGPLSVRPPTDAITLGDLAGDAGDTSDREQEPP